MSAPSLYSLAFIFAHPAIGSKGRQKKKSSTLAAHFTTCPGCRASPAFVCVHQSQEKNRATCVLSHLLPMSAAVVLVSALFSCVVGLARRSSRFVFRSLPSCTRAPPCLSRSAHFLSRQDMRRAPPRPPNTMMPQTRIGAPTCAS